MNNTSQIIFELIQSFLESYFSGSQKYWREEVLDIAFDIFYLENEEGEYLSEFYSKLSDEFYGLYQEEEDRSQYEKIHFYFYELDKYNQTPLLNSLLKSLYQFLLQEAEKEPYLYKLKKNFIAHTLEENINDLLLDFSEVRADLCVEVLERSLVVPLKEIQLKTDFLLFQRINTYENHKIAANFSDTDGAEMDMQGVSDGIYTILKLPTTTISSNKIIQEFTSIYCDKFNHGEFSQISSFETKELLRNMAMYRAGFKKVEVRKTTKQAKQVVSQLMTAIGMDYDFFTNVKNVEKPFQHPSLGRYNSNMYWVAESVSFFAIGEKQLYFFQQIWNQYGE